VNGAQDMGGVHGFGAVVAESDEPVFHADWERRVFALTLAMGATGEWDLDASRFARENRPPDEYLDKSYYEIDRVRARNMNPLTHTRLPRYVRGRVGTITATHGCHVFPDTNAHGLGEEPQWLYTVSFDGRELWGLDADATLAVSVDAFEPYMEPAL